MKLLPPPGPERRRQLALLGIVLFGLVIVAWYQWPQAAPVAPTSNLPTGRPQTSAQVYTLPEPVRFGDLEQVPPPTEIGRNPFSFGMRAAPPQGVGRSMPTVSPIAETPALPQGPPPISLRLTGLMVGPGTNRTMATLKDPGSGALFHAFEGDIVDGRYRLVKVGTQSVVLSYVDGSGIRTLGLGN
jgi:hypothetical protein